MAMTVVVTRNVEERYRGLSKTQVREALHWRTRERFDGDEGKSGIAQGALSESPR